MEQAPAAVACGVGVHAAARLREPHEPPEERLRLGEPPDPDQRLDLVGDEAQVTGLADASRTALLDQWPQLVVRLGWIAEREREETQGPG